jgi:hypothetical protein
MCSDERQPTSARPVASHAPSAIARAVRACAAAAVLSCAAPASADDFRAFTWGFSSTAATPNLSPMVRLTRDSNLDDIAARLRLLPAGSRYLLLFFYPNDLADNPADRCMRQVVTLSTRLVPAPTSGKTSATAPAKISRGRTAAAPTAATPTLVPVTVRTVTNVATPFRGPWMENGIAAVRARVTAMVAGLKARGVAPDGFILDNETTLHATHFMGTDGAFAAVQADPRWPALATQLGLPRDISSPSVMYWGSPAYYRWTDVMSARFDAAMNTAVYQPIRAVFPNAVVSNYMSARVTSPNVTPDITGKLDTYSTPGFGTHDTGEFYGMLTGLRLQSMVGSLNAMSAGAGDAWAAFRLEVHKARGLMASSSRPKQAWIAARSWGDAWSEPGIQVGFASGPYWDETVLQLGMHGISTFLNWNPDAWMESQDHSAYNRASDRAVLDGLLAELDARVGAAVGTSAVLKQPTWDDRVIATGRRVGSQMVWRFSFDEGIDSVQVSFTDGSTATVTPDAGRRGAWFSHPATKSLVMDGRGSKPAMLENVSQSVASNGN